MGIHSELNDLGLEGLVQAFHDPSPGGDEFACSFYSEVTIRLRQNGGPGRAFLWGEIENADEDRLRAIVFALSARPEVIGPGEPLSPDEQIELQTLLVHLCADTRPLVVAEAVNGLAHLGDQDAKDTVVALRNHGSPHVRGSVLRYVTGLFPSEALPLLIESLSDPDYIVRESAVDQLEKTGKGAAEQIIPLLLPLLDDPHIDVRHAARTALENLQRG